MDRVGVVHLDVYVAGVAVVLEGGAVGVEVVMEVEEAVVVKRYLLKILMPSWRSTMQKQCKSKTQAVVF